MFQLEHQVQSIQSESLISIDNNHEIYLTRITKIRKIQELVMPKIPKIEDLISGLAVQPPYNVIDQIFN